MKTLYLIKRGPRPESHRAPFHPVILCDRRRTADLEAAGSQNRAWVWERRGWEENGQGWLLTRWEGLEIDYRPVVHGFDLPGGARSGFWRDYPSEGGGDLVALLEGAVWWSDRRMPGWLEGKGVVYPADDFTQQAVLDDLAADGVSGAGRVIPAWWPRDAEAPARDGRRTAALGRVVAEVEEAGRRAHEGLVVTREGDRHVAEVVEPASDLSQ